MSSTVDANVLLYASDAASPFHRPARRLLEQLAAGGELLYLFWPTAMAYLDARPRLPEVPRDRRP